MKTKTKEFWKKLTPFIVIALIFSLIATSMFVYFEQHKNHKSPLTWCLLEIGCEEDYDTGFVYAYQKLEPEAEIQKEAYKGMTIYAYYITVFTMDRMGEWSCFIECFHRDWFDSFMNLESYRADEVYLIDCDLVREIIDE